MAVAIFTSLQQLTTDAGAILNGGSVTVYAAGTTTPLTLYSDPDLAGGHETTNPITLNSAGYHAMTYIAAAAYKVLVKTSGGVTVQSWTRDNIDPGVPIGSGILAIANGGTGASDAATALSNLGAATAAELADVAADVASVASTLASTEKTHIATGTTAQRPASPNEGDIRRNTSTSRYEGYTGSVWAEFVTSIFGSTLTEDTTPDPAADFLLSYDNSATTNKKVKPSSLATALNATQTQMEAGSATTALVSPAVQHYHSSAAKAWVEFDGTGTPSVTVSRNVTSLTDNGQGNWTINLTTAFSSANYAWPGSAQDNNTTGDVFLSRPSDATKSTTALQVIAIDLSATKQDSARVTVAMFGDQ